MTRGARTRGVLKHFIILHHAPCNQKKRVPASRSSTAVPPEFYLGAYDEGLSSVKGHMSLLAQYAAAAAAAAAAEEERAWMGHKLIITDHESGLRTPRSPTPECVQRERDPSRSWPLCGPKDVGNAESLWTFRESAECDGALRMTLYGMSVRRVVRWEMNQWAWVSA